MTCDGACLWHRKFDALEVDFVNLETDLRVKRRQISELQRKLDQQEEERVEAPLVQALFDYWRLLLRDGRKSVKLGEKRRQAIKGRLREGYSPKQLKMAIDGALHGAFVNDAGKRFDDLELIFRNEVQVDRFIDRWMDRQQYRTDYMASRGNWPEMDEEMDTSDRNVARMEELLKVRRYLDEFEKEPPK